MLMRPLVPLAMLAAGAVAIAAACGGDSEEPAAPTATGTAAIPTATPFAVEPQPTIVSGGSPETPREMTYIVEAGDTLSEIAARFEVSVEAIMAANGITDATLIFVGQELAISAAPAEDGGEGEGEGDGDGAPADDAGVYVVQPGDTAWEIARAFGHTVEELAEANGLSVDELVSLQPGDELTLPRPR